ncbi:GumC family protein [Nitratireductor basaltis]|uniref:Exopolysaccharide transport family protein n=1 Tax=Nitratireductor basaltis TaxID=472175 RepID=A0A084UBV0_9HYPH|nr:Wzz/FepE/Etk N-terminal domain-containing protein [Nitratireductor basaltis]KFB10436.1 Exopolysaccharide transport family protein [Nitratireductor basaltis]
MNSDRAAANDVDVDLGRLFGSLRRHWLGMLLFALISAALVFLLAAAATPKFRAETRVLIEQRETVFTRPQGEEAAVPAALDAEAIASQAEIMASAPILTKVARDFDLASLDEFDTSEPSFVEQFLTIIGMKADPIAVTPEEAVLASFREKLEIYRVENARVIVISFSSEDPRLAAAIPNAIADAYLENQRDARQQSNADATEWLEPEIADLRERVREVEERVARYRAESDLLIGQNNTVLATQQLSEISSELSRARAARAAAEADAQAARRALNGGGSLDTLPDVLESGLVERLRERQVDLQAQIADLSTTLLGNHPRIRALQSQLSDLDAQIGSEIRKIITGLETRAETARQREEDLTAEVNRLKAESARADEEQVELRALEREAAAQRELLESYLTRYREASARRDRDLLPVDARIFSRAIVPQEAYFPKVLPLTIAAFVAALLVGAIVLLLRELFSGRAMRPAYAHGETEAPSAASAKTGTAKPAAASPELPPAPRPLDMEPAAQVPTTPAGLTALDIEKAADRLVANGVTRALFISPEGDEAAAAAVLVAREIADTGLRVLLLDLTSTGAASRPMLETSSYAGITNILAAEAQFADIIHADLYSDCHVIPIGTADPARALSGIDRLPLIMNSLTTAYEIVLVECGVTDAAGIERLADDNTQIFVSLIDPEDEAIEETAEALKEEGFGSPVLVSPVGHEPETVPPGRTVA